MTRMARMTRIRQLRLQKALPYSCDSWHSCHSAVRLYVAPPAGSLPQLLEPGDDPIRDFAHDIGPDLSGNSARRRAESLDADRVRAHAEHERRLAAGLRAGG